MRIVLGVTGGIAAYKAAELARLLIQNGHEVQAVLTAGAEEFIRPLTFATLTGQKVITGSDGHPVVAPVRGPSPELHDQP